MMNKMTRLVFLLVVTIGGAFIGWPCWLLQGAQKPAAPHYPDATYGGEAVTLENSGMRLTVYKRLTGWGWVEISNSAGELIAVLDHFGEVDPVVSGRSIPVRIEAQRYQLDKGDFGQRLTFPVRLIWYQTVAKSPWGMTGLSDPALEGTVSITLEAKAPVAKLVYDLKPLRTLGVRYFRGPWLKVGSGSFGVAKADGIFPGLEWLVGDEWSSGTDWFQHPDALRMVPHPFKVAAPLMAISWKGTGIGLAWNPLEEVMPGKRYLQPVYASPNFLDRANNHLMGLMLPSVAWGMEENTPPVRSTKPGPAPLELSPGSPIHIEAEVFLAKGNSLDVVVDWVKRHGLPEPPTPRYPLSEAMDRIARQYNTSLWHEGRGWGKTADEANAYPPVFLEHYAREGRDREIAKGLAEKLAWASKQPQSGRFKQGVLSGGFSVGREGPRALALWPKEAQLARGRDLLSYQTEDGSFRFDPEGRHKSDYSAPFFLYCDSIFKPLGVKGDTALDLSVDPAMELLLLADSTGEQQFRAAAHKALDYCLTMQRPEGGDWWETPLHSPNLLAAGHAAIAYYLGYKAFNDPRYLERAIYWIRAILPFTHLWQPEEVAELYDTKPCFNMTAWYLSNWVTKHVQWEVLVSFAASTELGIDWGKIDREIDWHRFQKGITVAVLRWMIDHKNPTQKWDPDWGVADADPAKRGLLDTCFPDDHNSVTGVCSGGLIEPDSVAINLEAVLERE
jgi:hypothetical protein